MADRMSEQRFTHAGYACYLLFQMQMQFHLKSALFLYGFYLVTKKNTQFVLKTQYKNKQKFFQNADKWIVA